MRSTLLVLGLGLWLGLAACSRNNAGPAHAHFEGARGTIVFSPDGTAVAVPQPSHVVLYDLDQRRVRFQHPTTRPNIGMTFAPNGKFVLLVEANDAPRYALTLLRADTGATVFIKEVVPNASDQPFRFDGNDANRLFAISDDGRFVAFLRSPQLELYSTETGSLAYRDDLERALGVVAFEPYSHRLVFGAEHDPRVRVTEQVDGRWQTAQTFEGAFDPTWTRSGLFFGSSKGLERFRDDVRTVVLDADRAFPGAASFDSSLQPHWAASPEGQFVATWTDRVIDVWPMGAVETKQPLFSHQEEGLGTGKNILWFAVFVPGHLRGYVGTGDLIDLEIPSGRVVRRFSFGPHGSWRRSVYTDGASSSANYVPRLSPDGRYMAIDTADGDASIYRIE